MPSTMTTPLTWPTRDELDHVLNALEEGMNEYDMLTLRLHCLLDRDHDDRLPEDVTPPTLEDIGALARFVEFARLDLVTIERWIDDARKTYTRAAYHVADEEASVDA